MVWPGWPDLTLTTWYFSNMVIWSNCQSAKWLAAEYLENLVIVDFDLGQARPIFSPRLGEGSSSSSLVEGNDLVRMDSHITVEEPLPKKKKSLLGSSLSCLHCHPHCIKMCTHTLQWVAGRMQHFLWKIAGLIIGPLYRQMIGGIGTLASH